MTAVRAAMFSKTWEDAGSIAPFYWFDAVGDAVTGTGAFFGVLT